MSDHAWTQENVAAFVVGGLTAAEMERLENHARECSECAASVAAARKMDRHLESLFAFLRPGPALEDGAVRSVRGTQKRRFGLTDRLPRLAIAAGVLLVLTIVGAMTGAIVGDGRLPLPGSASMRRAAPANEPSLAQAKRYDTPEAAASAALLDTLSKQLSRILVSKNYGGYEAKGGGNGDLNGTGTPNGTTAVGSGGRLDSATTGGPVPSGGFALNGPIQFGASPHPVQAVPSGSSDFTISGQTLQTGIGPTPSTLNNFNATSAGGNASPTFRPVEHLPALAGESKAPEPSLDGTKLAVKREQSLVRDTPPAADPDPASHRVVIRSGEMEFEVDSFDAASAIVTKLMSGLRGAFVATVNSDKLANGKVRGSITVRTPPEYLDRLVLDLRRDIGAAGELKGMKISSQDVTKQYTDLESRLRAARAMEQRLLQMIKDGKGEIKQLLDAERELGKWRTQIEEFEGEMRYYANLAALATLTITLTEKEIRTAAAVTESEKVQAGVEVEDVDKAYQQTLAVVAEMKGRVVKSEVKQLAAGQFNASLQFEVPPDAAGPVRDRLRQLGRVARLEIDRDQHAEGGSLPADGKVKHGETTFLVQIYNLANIAPRETAVLRVAVPDVRAAYQALRDAAAKAAARVLVAQLNEQDVHNITAQFDLEVRRAEDGAFRAALDAVGEVISRQVSRAPEGDNSTDSKVRYQATLFGINRLNSRETTTLTLQVPDVDQAAALLSAQVAEAKGRQLGTESSRDPSGKATAKLVYEVPLAAAGLADRFKAAGTVRGYQSARDLQAPAGKYATARIDVTLVSGDQIVAEGDGLWPQIRRGLSYSMTVLLVSVTWVVFGLCVVLPWGVVGYAGYRLVRRLSRRPVVVSPTTPV